MMHFFIRSKIHLDAFTSRRDVIEVAPVVNAVKLAPTWWKKLPKSTIKPGAFSPSATMKTCPGFIDYYKKSIGLPLWSELAIDISPDRNIRWQFSDKRSDISPHPEFQYEGFGVTGSYTHLKIVSPWLFKTKENVDWILTDPVYNKNSLDTYTIAQGVLNFKKQISTNLQLFINVSSPKTYTIPFGSVFLFTPMTDKKVVVHRHLISEEEFNSKSSTGIRNTFINKYLLKQNITTCPYKDFSK